MIPLDLIAREKANILRLERSQAELRNWMGMEGATGVDSRDVLDEGHPADGGVEVDTDGRPPLTGWNRVYTDGSKSEEGTGAAFVEYNGEEEVANGTIRLWEHCSVFQSELVAIRGGLRYIKDRPYAYRECDFINDSRSALEALRTLRRPTKLIAEIERLRREVLAHTRLRWHWVKAHNGNTGNERADELAKQVTKEEEDAGFTLTPLRRVKEAVRDRTLREWQKRWDVSEAGR